MVERSDVKKMLLAWQMPEKMPIIAAAVIAAAALVIFIYFWRQRKKRQENEHHAMRRMREEALDRVLANPMQKDNGSVAEMQRRPFQVEYSQGEEGGKKKRSDKMFQLTEITELSQRKYMFRCRELISIGNQFGSVTILTDASEAKQVYCQIFFYEGANYVRSIGKKDIFLKRKGKKVMVNDLGIKLLSKDSFTVDKTTFQIEFL